MNRTDPDQQPAAGHPPAPDQPRSDELPGPVAEPDDSGLGEEDPGAALDDPAVREAFRQQSEKPGRSGRNERSDR